MATRGLAITGEASSSCRSTIAPAKRGKQTRPRVPDPQQRVTREDQGTWKR